MSAPKRTRTKKRTWGFRLLFHVGAGLTFEPDRATWALQLGLKEGRVVLRRLPVPKNAKRSNRRRYALVGRGFPSAEAARKVGGQLKVAAAVLFAGRMQALDLGRDHASSSMSQRIKDVVQRDHGVQVRDDIHGLDIYEDHPRTTRFSISAHGTVLHSFGRLQEGLRRLLLQPLQLNEQTSLALELYNSSRLTESTKARFLTLVTVIEVLAPPASRSHAITEACDKLIKHLPTIPLDAADLATLKTGIGLLKKTSINEACRAFVVTHCNGAEVELFRSCYLMRSAWTHSGQADPVERVLGPLENLVRKLLLAVVGLDPADPLLT